FLNEFLIICDNAKTRERPANLRSEQGNHCRVLVFRREDPVKGDALPEEEFLRRACQAMRGVAMTHLEKTYFHADKDENKRAKVLGGWTGGRQPEWLPYTGSFRLGIHPSVTNLTTDSWTLNQNNALFMPYWERQYLLGGRINLNPYDSMLSQHFGYYPPAI